MDTYNISKSNNLAGFCKELAIYLNNENIQSYNSE